MSPDHPSEIGPYQILRVAGTGRRGVVYEARLRGSEMRVALKVFSQRTLRTPEFAANLVAESDAGGRLSHRNIAKVVDRVQYGDTVAVVSEFVEGSSLADRFAAGQLPLAAAIHVVREAARALDYAHRQGVVHGHLNPGSVLVSPDLSVVKVKGFSKRPAHTSPEDGTAAAALADVKSFPYWAPEVKSGAPADQRSDVYSLGVVCYQALTGVVPRKVSMPSELNRQLPLALDAIVLRCLASDPSQRYASAQAFLEDLDRVEQVEHYQVISELKRLSGGRLFSKGGDGTPHATPSRLVLLGIAGMAALLVCAAGVALVLFRGASPAPDSRATPRPAPSSTPMNGAQARRGSPSPTPLSAAPPSSTAPTTQSASAASSAATAAARLEAEAARALAAQKERVDAGAASAEAELRAFLAKYAGTTSGADGYLLLAKVQEREGKLQDAIVTCEETARRYHGDPRAAAALFRESKFLESSHAGDGEVLKRLAIIGSDYAATPWFVPAMSAKMAIEDRLKTKEVDPSTGMQVPASLLTRRRLVAGAPQDPAAEAALVKIAETCDEMKQYRQAAAAYAELATRFPGAKLDGWFRAGELLERRLDAPAEALTAYLKVPPTSPRYHDAQERARRLGRR